jgi:hypothetical protein
MIQKKSYILGSNTANEGLLMIRNVLIKISELMTTAFGLVAALAWNQAIQSLFKEGGPLYFVSIYGIWVYALLVTFIAVFCNYLDWATH